MKKFIFLFVLCISNYFTYAQDIDGIKDVKTLRRIIRSYRDTVKTQRELEITLRKEIDTRKENNDTLKVRIQELEKKAISQPQGSWGWDFSILALILACFIVLFLACFIFYYRLKHICNALSKLQDQNESLGDRLFSHQETLIVDMKNKKENQVITPPTEPPVLTEIKEQIVRQTLYQSYFQAEIMMTSGPRKYETNLRTETDIELGEDVAGFAVVGDKAVFWVLDGTSDALVLRNRNQKQYFSSRHLAQSIAINVQSHLSDLIKDNISSFQLLKKALHSTEVEWRKVIGELSPEDRSDLLTTIDSFKNHVQCSTTVIVGVLSLDGKLDVCRVGDSKVFAFDTSKKCLAQDLANNPPNDKMSRLFVSLQKQQGEVVVDFSPEQEFKYQQVVVNDIQYVVAFSDGLNSKSEEYVKNIAHLNYEVIRKHLPSIRATTADDKSFCVIQIKDTNKS